MSWKSTFVLSALLLVSALTVPSAAAERISSSRLLPAGTRAYFVVRDAEDLQASWKTTTLAGLEAAPEIQPFLRMARAKFDAAAGDLREIADIELSELQAAASGEVSLAVVEVAGGEAAVVALAGVDSKSDDVSKLIAKIDEGLRRRGAEHTTRDASGGKVHSYQWRSRDGELRRSSYFVTDNVLAVSNNAAAVEGVLTRSAAMGESAPSGSLASVERFLDVQRRLDAEAGDLASQLRWYVEPLANARLASGEAPEFAAKHGFDAVQAVGGTLNFNAPGCDVLARAAVFAPPPREKAMRVLSLVEGAAATPPAWLIDDIDSYADLKLNLREVIDHAGGLFDDLAADGIEGTFEDILKDLASEDGPGVDIRAELLPIAGPRVLFIADHSEPLEADSTRTVVAIAVSDEMIAADIVQRLMQDDPDVTRVDLLGHPHPLWQVSDSETASFPKMGMMVAHGFILTSNNGALIRKLLTAPADAPKLADAMDYKLVAARMETGGADGASLRSFSRQERDFAVTYAMLREGRLDDASSTYGNLVRWLFGDDADRLSGLPRLDFTLLPEFAAVTPFLLTQGIFVKNQPTGWMITGFVPK